MITPTIHLNGSSKDSLLEELCTALDALHAAETALHCCSPNARDYYPQGPEAFPGAVREHLQRVKAIRDVRAALEAILETVADQ